ncbi:hypothetical protein KAS41_00520 [Candidatus Parcubacteria bacterium]|nr:hypothetical protein [Candidatus Parcubacteria bacterium]
MQKEKRVTVFITITLLFFVFQNVLKSSFILFMKKCRSTPIDIGVIPPNKVGSFKKDQLVIIKRNPNARTPMTTTTENIITAETYFREIILIFSPIFCPPYFC